MMSRLSRGAMAGIAVGVAGIIASSTPLGLHLGENLGLEVLFRLRGPRPPPPDVVIVSIDKESADRLGQDPHATNWHRSLHARLTETLAERGAAVIAFDIFFEKHADREGDSVLADAFRKANNVVLCERLQAEKLLLKDQKGGAAGEARIARKIPPIPLLAEASVATSPYPLPKVPVKVSRDWTFQTTVGDSPTPTLPVVVFQLYVLPAVDDFLRFLEQVAPTRPANIPRSGEEMLRTSGVVGMIREIRGIFEKDPLAEAKMLEALDRSPHHPADPKKRRILRSLIRLYGGGVSKFLNFYGPARTMTTIPFYMVLAAGSAAGPRPPSPVEVAGKAVFVGSSESRQLSQKDGFYTVYTSAEGVDLSGVEIAATAFANLVEDMSIRPLPFHVNAVTLLVWAVGVGMVSFAFRPAFAIPGVAAFSLLYLAAAEFRFAAAGIWYPVVLPLAFQAPLLLLGAVGWNYVVVSRERRNVRRAFGYYLPVEIVDGLAENIEGLKVRNQVVNGICLATDAEHYTSLSESKEPMDLAEFMNRYYEAVFDPVRRHGGMVSNVVGDSMLALWLATKENPSPLDDTCHAALEIDLALRGFRRSGDADDFPTRIGLHYGRIFLGNIGAGNRYEYRPVGDIVNTATRIEGLNKYLGTRILVSREVVSSLHGFLTRDMGSFLLAGKTKPVHVHELVDRFEDSSPRQREYCARFSEGIDAFRRQSWDEAAGKFHETLGIREGDGPSLFYLNLCARYSRNPPGDPWDGIVHMGSK